MVNDHIRLLLDDQPSYLRDELFWIFPEHEEPVRPDALEDARRATTRDGRGLCDFAKQIVFHAIGGIDIQIIGAGVVLVEVRAVRELVSRSVLLLDATRDRVGQFRHDQMLVDRIDGFFDELVVIETDGVRVLVVDALPEFLELLLLPVRVEWIPVYLAFQRVADEHLGGAFDHAVQHETDRWSFLPQGFGQQLHCVLAEMFFLVIVG